jgi:hypothetical protein
VRKIVFGLAVAVVCAGACAGSPQAQSDGPHTNVLVYGELDIGVQLINRVNAIGAVQLGHLKFFVLGNIDIERAFKIHSTSSGVSGFSVSWLVPAELHSMAGWSANTCSAVGLRRRFWLQMKRTRFMGGIGESPV